MRAFAVATSLGMLIASSNACAGDDSARKSDAGTHAVGKAAADAEPSAARTTELGAQVSSDEAPDLHSLVIAALIETEGSLVARCPCLTAGGAYQSTRECMDAVSLGRNWVDCASSLELSPHDDPEIRASLRCNIQELKQRSECLMGSGCSDDDIVACMSETLGCPKLPLDLLSQIAVQCQIAFSR